MKNYYEILEVNKKASQETISKVYKFLAKKYHPDANPDNKQEAEERFKEISEAYEILSNEEKRKEYNTELETQEAQSHVDYAKFEELRNYCVQLENELNNLKSNSSSNMNPNFGNSTQSTQSIQQTTDYQDAMNQAYNDALNKAYHDAYINNLKNMGYKIRYKKTFKDYVKNFIELILSIAAIILIIKVALSIPAVKENFLIFKK